MPIFRKCEYCGKLVKKAPSKSVIRKMVFCSKNHEYAWKRTEEGRNFHREARKNAVCEYKLLEEVIR